MVRRLEKHCSLGSLHQMFLEQSRGKSCKVVQTLAKLCKVVQRGVPQILFLEWGVDGARAVCGIYHPISESPVPCKTDLCMRTLQNWDQMNALKHLQYKLCGPHPKPSQCWPPRYTFWGGHHEPGTLTFITMISMRAWLRQTLFQNCSCG